MIVGILSKYGILINIYFLQKGKLLDHPDKTQIYKLIIMDIYT